MLNFLQWKILYGTFQKKIALKQRENLREVLLSISNVSFSCEHFLENYEICI